MNDGLLFGKKPKLDWKTMQQNCVYDKAAGVHIWTDHKGLFHRSDGPALVWDNGRVEWYFHDLLHRTDGPAVIDEHGYPQWWLMGKKQRSM